MFQKSPPFRSGKWLQHVRELDCVICWRPGPSQAAHANHLMKGMGTKAPDVFTVPMCPECHREFDQGRKWPKEEKRQLMDRWILDTVLRLAEKGAIKP